MKRLSQLDLEVASFQHGQPLGAKIKPNEFASMPTRPPHPSKQLKVDEKKRYRQEGNSFKKIQLADV